MKISRKILSVLLVLLMLLSNVTAFAASKSYDAGYDAGYDYAYSYTGRLTSGTSVYNNNYRDSRAHRDIKSDLGDGYNERDFKEGFVDGFEDGYEADTGEDKDVDYASELGKMLGEIYGARDYQNNKKSDWKKVLPGRNDLRRMYDLDKQNTAYINAFVKEFNKSFEEGYIKSFENAMHEPDKVTLEQGVSDGEAAGAIAGAAYGAKDYYEGRDSLVYAEMPSTSDITKNYFLNNDNSDYEDGFISGFLRAYEEAYNKAYREANMDNALKKVKSEVIPISGTEIKTADNRFTISIPSGIYYHDVNLIVTTTYDAGTRQYGSLIKASDSYEVKIVNSSGKVDNSKFVEIKFEYYGDKAQGGIYRQSGNTWLYVPTKIEDGVMSAKINPETLSSSGTTYSAFSDTNVKIFRDSRGHWAANEIDALVRRGVVSGYSDNTFRPDNYITRAEFLTLVGKVYNWNTSWYYSSSEVTYNDSDTFGNYSHIIYYASYHNIIYGYSDGYFRPNNLITYSEVDAIMKRVMPYGSFSWYNTANDMLYEKQTRSNSLNSLNNNITRAEVVYMLYSLTE